MALDPDLADRDATALARLIVGRQLSCEEVIESAIRRVEAHAPLNFIASERFAEALEDARRPGGGGPLAGVPFLVKDLIARVAGAPQTEGSLMLSRQRATTDSELVRRYRAAGLQVLGRTTTSEFGHAPITAGRLFGVTRNPWAPELTSGGSSGGAAVAVATRCVAIAHGNDSGGSLRIPASCCGVFGFKPAMGTVPMEPAAGAFSGRFAAEHVISVSVRDSARVLDLTASREDPRGAYVIAATQPVEHPLRVALQVEPVVDVPVHAECRTAVEETAAVLEADGHMVDVAGPRLDGGRLMGAWLGLWADATGWQVVRAARRAGKPITDAYFDTMTWRLYRTARSRTAMDSLDDLVVLTESRRAIDQLFERYDVWLTPTLAQPPVAHGAFRPTSAAPSPYLTFSPFARLANVAGRAACSVPARWTDAGLPIGAQLVGRDEWTTFAAARVLEQARPWAARRPPVPAAAA
jgi:amidase